MAQNNSGPEDCCCSEEYDYLVVEERLSLPRVGIYSTDICTAPTEWNDTVAYTKGVTVDVDKQQKSIEVTFNIPNAISESEDPCFQFHSSSGNLPGEEDSRKTCTFRAAFSAWKNFPVNPFPWLRPEKRTKITVNIKHKRIGCILSKIASYSAAYSGVAVLTGPCPAPGNGLFLASWYEQYEKQECTFTIHTNNGDQTGTGFVRKCVDGGEDVELEETGYYPNSHLIVTVQCSYYSWEAYCFPSSLSTKFTISVEEVDP
jgi:hypothetical protein